MDDSTRPAYVSALPPLAWTAQEEATVQHLVDVHDHLRHELEQIHGLIDQVEAGAMDAGLARSLVNVMTMRQNGWTLGAYCASYCRILTTHHAIEDAAMFPRLLAGDAALAPVVDRLEQEHHVIADVLEDVDRALVRVVGDGDMSTLRSGVGRLDDILTSHLAWEESVLREPLARHGFF